MNTDGYLLIPTPDEVCQLLQMREMTNETKVVLKGWRERFYPECHCPEEQQQPTPQGEQTSEQNDPLTPPRRTDPPAGMPEMQPLAQAQAGTKASKEELEKKYNLTAVATKALPVENAKVVCENVEIVLCKTKDNKRQIWLHSKANKEYTLQIGTCLGQGGNGQFQSLVSDALPEVKKAFAWRFTRITSHKRDSAELANGYLIYHGSGVPASGAKITPQALYDIEKTLGNNVTLYGHAITRGGKTKVTITPAATPVVWIPNFSSEKTDESFSVYSLGHWLPSLESDASSGGGKFQGYHRPVFEVQGSQKPPAAGAAASSGALWHLQPNPNPSANALHIFTSKTVDLQAHEYMALHEPM